MSRGLSPRRSDRRLTASRKVTLTFDPLSNQLRLRSVREAVKIEPERLKVKKIFTVRSCCQGMAGKDTAGWKRRNGCCGDL
jgi:hypothetical protein